MYGMHCRSTEECTRNSCLYPEICQQLDTSQNELKDLLMSARKVPGINKVLIGSGVRYDLALLDNDYLEMITQDHIGGQLSIAPEHICNEVLQVMNKPKHEKYVEFMNKFSTFNEKHDKKQYLVPYFISSHPGTTLKEMLTLTLFLQEKNIKLEQVQNFTPTPMTIATTMCYTEHDPFTGKPVHVPKGEERAFQKALLQPHLEKNLRQLAKALKQLGRSDLIQKLTGYAGSI